MRWIRKRDGHVSHQIEESDLTAARSFFIDGYADGVSDIVDDKTMCIMQLVSMMTSPVKQRLTPESVEFDDYEGWKLLSTGDEIGVYADTPPCVSGTITSFMIELNDGQISPPERQRLLELATDVVDTCPVKLEVRTAANGFDYEYEVEDHTPEYLDVENRRRWILGNPADDRTLDQKFDAVRRAAALLKN